MAGNRHPVTLSRDVAAVVVPSGSQTRLLAGCEVEVFHQLGSSVTLLTSSGALVQIQGVDADAVGLIPVLPPNADGSQPYSPVHVRRALEGVYDPEIPVNIVDLGLVYRLDEVLLDGDSRRIEVDMTMTAPGCGMGDVLAANVKQSLLAVLGVDEVEVTLVFTPPWDASRMSEETRLKLGLF